ncbi:hypothetical protein FF1_014869 [Malus domestica]
MLCSLYLRGVETRFNPNEQNDDGGDDRNVGGLSIFSQKVRSFGGRKFILLPKKEVDRAHWFVLHNYDKVQPYLIEHMEELKLKSNENLCQRQEQEFPKWFENRIYGLREMGSLEATNDLHYLSCKPDVRDHTYNGCSSWKVMQRVQCRNLWDVPENEVAEEVDEDIEPTTDNHVYQEDEFNEVHWAVQGDQESLLSSDDDMDEDSEEKPHVYVVEIDPTYRNITMEGKRKRIRVAVVIPSSNTQGSANDMPFYFECYLYYVA